MTDAARPPRSRWIWVLVVLAVLIAGAAVATEFIARSIVTGTVRALVIDNLDLPADQQLDVAVDGIVLPQLISGTLDTVHVASDALTLESITGGVEVTAQDVSVATGEAASATATVTIDDSQVLALLEAAGTDLPVASITFDDPNVVVDGFVVIFGTSLPLTVIATPGIEGGELALTPVSASFAGAEFSVDDIPDALASFSGPLTATQHLCIADQLPAGVTLTSLDIVDGAAVVGADITALLQSDATSLEPGVCA